MQFTTQQNELFRWIERGRGHGMLTSVAGSGKTSSIIECLNYIDDETPVIVCSFTKLVATELAKRVEENEFHNVSSTTLNSLGWGLCKNNVPGVKLDQFKTDNILKYQLSRLGLERELQGKIYMTVKGSVKRIIGLLKSYIIVPDKVNFKEAVREIVLRHDIDAIEGTSEQTVWARENLLTLIESVYRTSLSFINEMDFDDQKCMPVFNGWKGNAPAFIIVDECQDVNICDIELINSFIGRQTRTLWVGDPKQSIYGFRGSLPDACEQIITRFNCQELVLSCCWRCPDKVLALAKEICPAIEGPVPNPRGEGVVEHIETAEFKDMVAIGDYVLCRVTAPLIKRCLELVRRDIPAKVKGRDVGKSLLTLIETIKERLKRVGITASDPRNYLMDFIQDLNIWKSEQTMMLEKAGRDEQAIAVSDKAEALEAFCMDADSLPGVMSKIESLFADDVDDDKVVLFLTGHRVKGLQRKRIFILRPELMPHPRAKSEIAKEQELNLKYVMITRSESELYFVLKEKEEK